jgi:hypothetical protein
MIERDAGIDLVENSDMVIKTQAKNEEYIIWLFKFMWRCYWWRN